MRFWSLFNEGDLTKYIYAGIPSLNTNFLCTWLHKLAPFTIFHVLNGIITKVLHHPQIQIRVKRHNCFKLKFVITTINIIVSTLITIVITSTIISITIILLIIITSWWQHSLVWLLNRFYLWSSTKSLSDIDEQWPDKIFKFWKRNSFLTRYRVLWHFKVNYNVCCYNILHLLINQVKLPFKTETTRLDL